MSTHNIGFYEDLTKNIFELSSNMHLISSAGRSDQCTGWPKLLTQHFIVVFFFHSIITFLTISVELEADPPRDTGRFLI